MPRNNINDLLVILLVTHRSRTPVIFTFVDLCIGIPKFDSNVTFQLIFKTNSLDMNENDIREASLENMQRE